MNSAHLMFFMRIKQYNTCEVLCKIWHTAHAVLMLLVVVLGIENS